MVTLKFPSSSIDKTNALFAGDLNGYTRWLRSELTSYAVDSITVKEEYVHYLSNITAWIEESREKLETVREVISGILSAMQNNIKGGRAIRDVVGQSTQFPNLNAASYSLVPLLDELLSSFTDLESFCRSSLNIIKGKLAK